MKLETFFKHFDLLAEAPNGVQKLRELILDLAVRGKLVPQDKNDEPAAVLLERIKIEKERLVKEGKIKNQKTVSPAKLQKLVYQIPPNWKWCNFSDVIFSQEGPGIRNWQFKSDGIKLLNVKNIVKGELILDNSDKYISEEEFEQKYKHFLIEEGDLLFASSGNSWGKTAFFKDPGYKVIVNTSTIRMKFIDRECHNKFLRYFLESNVFKNQMIIQLSGMQPNFGSSHLMKVLIPLPPLNEQKRIVTKVDELMKLCDELEARQKKKRETRILINNAALNKLLTAETPETFTKNWQRISDNFDILYSAPENIGKLRQAILQLAVMGKLVPQNANDEPAAVLLERIKKEKERLVKEGKVKKEKSLPAIKDDKIPFDLPIGWEWVRLENVCELITKGSSPKWQGVNYVELEQDNGILFITSENVRNYSIDLTNPKYVEKKFNQIEPRSILSKNDILMNIVGASIGRSAIYNTDEIANINQAVCLIRIIGQDYLLNLNYLLHFFNSPICISFMFDKQVDNARANLSMGNISKFPIPIPPLNEQKRIVTKVDKLMKLCDELETKLTQTQTDSEKIINAAVKQLLTV
jgi:type I restriction enzyme S subunit